MKERETFASRLGFVLISAGCAIGLGNVWRFPYIVGQYGGAAFVVIYIMFLLIMGLPIMSMEFSVGRASRKSITMSFQELEPKGTKWHWYGWFGMAGNYLLMMFYTTIAGWLLLYFFKVASGQFEGMTTAQVSEAFTAMQTQDVGIQLLFMALVVVLGMVVCSRGLKNGVEKANKAMMLCLLALLVVLAVRALSLPGAVEGLKFYLVPNFHNLMYDAEGNFRLFRAVRPGAETVRRGHQRGHSGHLRGLHLRPHHLPLRLRLRGQPGLRPQPDLRHPAQCVQLHARRAAVGGAVLRVPVFCRPVHGHRGV